jgi:hypothetical protein
VVAVLLAGFAAGLVIGAAVGVAIDRLIAGRFDAAAGRALEPSIAELNGRMRAWTTRLGELRDDLIWGPMPLVHADEAARPPTSMAPPDAAAPAPSSPESGSRAWPN